MIAFLSGGPHHGQHITIEEGGAIEFYDTDALGLASISRYVRSVPLDDGATLFRFVGTHKPPPASAALVTA